MIKEDNFTIDVKNCNQKEKEKIQLILFKNCIYWNSGKTTILDDKKINFLFIRNKKITWDYYNSVITPKTYKSKSFLNNFKIERILKWI